MALNHFAQQLAEWHDGQSSGLYAVQSMLASDQWPMFEDMIRAIRELKKCNAPQKLANTLQLMLECNPQYCAVYQKWLEDYSL